MVAFVRSTISQSGDGVWYISGAPVGDADNVRFGLVTDGCPIDEDPMDRNFEGAYLIFEINGSVVTRHYWDSAEDEDDEYWDGLIEDITEDYDGSSPIKIWLEQETGGGYSYAYINYTIFNNYLDGYKSIRSDQVWHIWGSSQGNESGVVGDFEFHQGDGWELYPWGPESRNAVPWNHEWTPPPPPPPIECKLALDWEYPVGDSRNGTVGFPIVVAEDFQYGDYGDCGFYYDRENPESNIGELPNGIPSFVKRLILVSDGCSSKMKFFMATDYTEGDLVLEYNSNELGSAKGKFVEWDASWVPDGTYLWETDQYIGDDILGTRMCIELEYLAPMNCPIELNGIAGEEVIAFPVKLPDYMPPSQGGGFYYENNVIFDYNRDSPNWNVGSLPAGIPSFIRSLKIEVNLCSFNLCIFLYTDMGTEAHWFAEFSGRHINLTQTDMGEYGELYTDLYPMVADVQGETLCMKFTRSTAIGAE